MGFLLQIVFEAIAFGGQLIALGMGLGFAQMTDPLRGVETPVLGQTDKSHPVKMKAAAASGQ